MSHEETLIRATSLSLDGRLYDSHGADWADHDHWNGVGKQRGNVNDNVNGSAGVGAGLGCNGREQDERDGERRSGAVQSTRAAGGAREREDKRVVRLQWKTKGGQRKSGVHETTRTNDERTDIPQPQRLVRCTSRDPTVACGLRNGSEGFIHEDDVRGRRGRRRRRRRSRRSRQKVRERRCVDGSRLKQGEFKGLGSQKSEGIDEGNKRVAAEEIGFIIASALLAIDLPALPDRETPKPRDCSNHDIQVLCPAAGLPGFALPFEHILYFSLIPMTRSPAFPFQFSSQRTRGAQNIGRLNADILYSSAIAPLPAPQLRGMALLRTSLAVAHVHSAILIDYMLFYARAARNRALASYPETRRNAAAYRGLECLPLHPWALAHNT
ncbi:hypothetical protein B0H13DRAFT_1926509 [Mycena leptocephala]|nr:hypothetical protein B0H13DRAFT_1926509 [Mycena leptocephala]